MGTLTPVHGTAFSRSIVILRAGAGGERGIGGLTVTVTLLTWRFLASLSTSYASLISLNFASAVALVSPGCLSGCHFMASLR